MSEKSDTVKMKIIWQIQRNWASARSFSNWQVCTYGKEGVWIKSDLRMLLVD